jgi:2-polyprenyl-3-methyl-5-hydroxy-6-metoxy-1,4-benzoquinol methylase
MTHATIDQQLAREVEHFNAHYADEASRGIAALSDFDRARYSDPPADTIYPREFFYHLLSPLRGKSVLEMACGNGIDASLCAHNGATVHAYDVAEASIDMVRRRANINGIAERVHTQVTGDFDAAFAGDSFDAIVGYAALHHLPMTELAERVYQRLRPGGVAVFAEPVINSRALHALRRCVPYSFWENTEDETPLDDEAIADFAAPFDRFVRREFQLTSRLWPMFPNCFALAKLLHGIDRVLLKAKFMRRFATVVVFGLYRDR